MPEIKNTFTQGKMNKDLDERIIPNGQYRDAMNIQVSTSEGSDIGTIQNILGNARAESAVMSGYKCVGSISDEKNNKLYWFITSDYVDAILEYSEDKTVSPVIIDTHANTANAVLKFGDTIITGINIIDDLLLWTDNINEPRRISISRCKKGNPITFENLANAEHTKLVVEGEEPPTKEDAYKTSTSGTNSNTIYLKSVDDLNIGDKLISLEMTSGGIWNFITSPPSGPNDVWITSIDWNNKSVTLSEIIFDTENWGIEAQIVFKKYAWLKEEHITVIKKRPLKVLNYKINPADPTDKNPLFEKIFPRFSYRYKYVDGEYSAFGPFTNVVFNSEYSINPANDSVFYNENTAYDTKEPYNAGMRNMIKSIELTDFVSPDIPDDVVQIDILYKQEDSTVVYILEVFEKDSSEWLQTGSNSNSDYKGKMIVDSENIYAALPDIQLLRPWDNVPKKALAQEITGNRVVYGNYTQGYQLNYPPKVISDYKLRFDGKQEIIKEILGDNLVVNPSFDTDLANWSLSNGATSANYYHATDDPNSNGLDSAGNTLDGSNRLYLDNVGLWNSPTGVIRSTDMTLEIGSTYKIKFDHSVVSGELRMYLHSSGLSQQSITGTGTFEKSFVAIADTVYFQFFGLDATPAFAYIDNVSLQLESQDTTIKTFNEGGLPSVKSQRNYQLGIVYGDKYGRETPVFTSSNSSTVIPWSDTSSAPLASYSLQLEGHLDSTHPSWADYYKFFVKETSGEYYNMIMDALYNITTEDLEEDNHVWISFAGSDRNKVSKDDYIILKKKAEDSDQIYEENKFRVLDVKSDPPDAIKYKYETLGAIQNNNAGTLLNNPINGSPPGIFYDPDKRPIITANNPEPTELRISKTNWLANEGQDLLENDGKVHRDPIYFSFTKIISSTNKQRSEKYKVVSIRQEGSSDPVYIIRLSKPITQDDSELAETGSTGQIGSNRKIRFQIKKKKTLEAFSGRFFVKVLSNNLIKRHLETLNATQQSYNYVINATSKIYYHADTDVSTGYDITSGLVNNNSTGGVPASDNPNVITGAGGLTNTEDAWSKLVTEMNTNGKRWFIDKMHVAATQMENNFARNSGYGWRGGQPNMISDIIYSGTLGNQSIPLPSGYSSVNNEGGDLYYPTINTIKPQNPGIDGNNLVNGLEGAVTSSSPHVDSSGKRRWKVSLNNTSTSNDYGTETGEHYLHVSFLAPGGDLHNGSWDNVDGATTLNKFFYSSSLGISRELQGIFGGGVFTNDDGTIIAPMELPIGSGSSGNTQGYGDPSPYTQGVLSFSNAKKLHDEQWDIPSTEEAFANKLIVGNKFRFGGDTEVYEIKAKSIKHVYNHTSWRKIWNDDGSSSGTLQGTNSSVEEAAIKFADTGSTTDRDALLNKIQDFGRANNRRVTYILRLDKDVNDGSGYQPVDGSNIDSNSPADIEFVSEDFELTSGEVSQTAAIWETEPKDNTNLDIYYEATQAYPINLNSKNRELFAPIGCRIELIDQPNAINGEFFVDQTLFLNEWNWDISGSTTYPQVVLNKYVNKFRDVLQNNEINYIGSRIRFFREDGGYTTAIIKLVEEENGKYKRFAIEPITETGLSWYNCLSFGNGIESDRIRDDFNAMTISNGVKANATIDRPYVEEHRKSGLIYSGIYNSTSGVNDLNQFIMAEKITKDLNPTYGSIQKLFQRRISLIAFCEDRVIGITSNKNALYNADGKPQLISTNAVLGDANPFVGDFGISTNPESFAQESYRAYFTDRQRGAVLRLSMDGLTPISDAGMHDYFRNNLKFAGRLIGTYDSHKKDYNLTLTDFLPQNILTNARIGEGEEYSQSPIDPSELILNGGISFGDDYTSAMLTPLEELINTQIETTTTITNHDLIPMGSLVSAVAATAGIPSGFVQTYLDNISSAGSNGQRSIMWNIKNLTDSSLPFNGHAGNIKITKIGYRNLNGTAATFDFQLYVPRDQSTHEWGHWNNYNSNVDEIVVASAVTTGHKPWINNNFYENAVATSTSTNAKMQIVMYQNVVQGGELIIPPGQKRGISIYGVSGNLDYRGTGSSGSANTGISYTTSNSHIGITLGWGSGGVGGYSYKPRMPLVRVWYSGPPVGSIQAGAPEIFAEPPADVPAWAEVQHEIKDVNNDGQADWSEYGNNQIDLFFGQASTIYGAATGSGTSVTGSQNSVAVNGQAPQTWITGTSNGVTAYNQYPSGTVDVDDYLDVDSFPSDYTIVQQDISTDPYIVNNFYEVIVKYNASYVNSQGVAVTGVPLINGVIDTNTSYTAGATIPGYIGTVKDNGGMMGINMIDNGNGEFRAVFRVEPGSYVESNDLNLFKVFFNEFEGRITDVNLYDITGYQGGGILNINDHSWQTNNTLPLYHLYSVPNIYYQNDSINWLDAPNGVTLLQEFNGSAPQTSLDGYKFSFTITNYSSGELTGYLNNAIGDNTASTFEGFYFTGIDANGVYEIIANMDGTITSMEKDGAAHGTIVASSAILSNTDITFADKLIFNPDSSNANFTGSISNISMRDLSTIFSGGSIDAWGITGFNHLLDNFIYFDDINHNIVFDNAPAPQLPTPPIQIEQYIQKPTFVGDKYTVKFDHNITSGSINGYYFNKDGYGFRFGSISGQDYHEKTYEIGESTISAGELYKTFVMYTETATVNGVLDNFVMQQELLAFNPQTISFNEEVRGWVSFKSFLPESGVNLSKEYYTVHEGKLWKHHDKNVNRNTFYNIKTNSTLTAVLNAEPSLIKKFNTLNYEGSQSKIDKYKSDAATGISNIESYNLTDQDGWFVESIITDKQKGSINEFIEKEGKWFNYIKGDVGDIINDKGDFSFQGLGIIRDTKTVN